MNVIESKMEFPAFYETVDEDKPSSWLFIFVHFVLFAAMLFCFTALETFGRSDTSVLIRQIGYTTYVLIILLTRGLRVENITKREVYYLVCTVVVTISIFITTLTLEYVRVIDYFGAASFGVGVYVFVIIVPRCWGEKAEHIIIPSIIIAIISVTSSLYVGYVDVVERRNALAAYAGLGILIFLGLSLRSGLSFLKRVFCLSCVAFLIVVMAVALGRTSIVACASSFLFVIWTGSTMRRKLLIIGVIILLLITLVLSPYAPVLYERFKFKGEYDVGGQSKRGLESRLIIWETALRQTRGIFLLGRGRQWIVEATGMKAHSSYLGIYFSFGIFAAVFWMIMCAIGFWAAVKTILLYKGTGRYPLAPFCVIYFLVLGLAESYFYEMMGGFGTLFYIGSGICLFEVNKAQRRRPLMWMEDNESMQEPPV